MERAAMLAGLFWIAVSGAAAQETEAWALLGSEAGLADSRFGLSVALERQLLLVGAPTDGHAALTGGVVRSYHFDGDAWTPTGLLVPDGLRRGDQFGWSVALSDGRAVFGSPTDDLDGDLSGAVYVATCSSGGCDTLLRLVQPGLEAGDQFGSEVDLDGTLLVVGAPGDDDLFYGGAVYVYELQAGAMPALVQKLLPEPGAGHQGLGVAVRCGPRWIAAGTTTGGVHVFARTPAGWRLDEVLEDPAPAQGDHFGSALALGGDRLLIGEPRDSAVGGLAHVYERGASWQIVQTLVPSDGHGGLYDADDFGASVALSAGRALIGAPRHGPGTAVGQAYLFERTAQGAWVETRRLGASASDGGDQLGWSVALDGALAVAGAPFAESPDVVSGVAYIYDMRRGDAVRPGSIHSGGSAAQLLLAGSSYAGASAMTADVGPLPSDSAGGILAARDAGFRPVGGVTLWLSPPFARLGPPVAADAGWLRQSFDPARMPFDPPLGVLSGETWTFQAWYVNPGAGGALGFSAAVQVAFD